MEPVFSREWDLIQHESERQNPGERIIGEPGYDDVNRNQGSVAYTADHLFGDGWDIHSNYRYQYIDFKGQTLFGTSFDGTSESNISRALFTAPDTNRINTVDTRALRRFGLGSDFEQTVLFGYDFQRVYQRAADSYLFGASNIDIYASVYGQTRIPKGSPYLNNDSLLDQHGLYAQDQIKIKQHLMFTLGGRQDFAKNTVANFLPGGADYARLDDIVTGRAGVTYLTDLGVASYFAFSTSFLPNAGTFVCDAATKLSDSPAAPSDARQVEGGVNFQPRTWNSFLTASVFQLNETNVLVASGMWPLAPACRPITTAMRAT